MAAEAEPFRVGDAHRDDMIDAREHVGRVLDAPVGVDRLCELEAAATAAARVDGDHGVAIRGEHLPVLHELVAELVHRPAVDAQDRRVALAFHVADRLHEKAVDRRAVGALERDFLDRRERPVP